MKYGITKYPEVIEFCGNLNCKISNQAIIFRDITKGNYINANAIKNVQEVELLDVKKIIFIENKANYIDYIMHKQANEFVIYHGGFYSPIKGMFFEKIYKASKKTSREIQYYHWSDIDIGGFQIFTRLRENIIQELLPYKMDKNTLIENQKNWKTFGNDYKILLNKLKEDEKFSTFFDVIDFMLEKNVKLEQESLIV